MPERTPTRLVRFGVFEFDPVSGDLRKAGRRIKLQHQPQQILTLLVSRPGELVTREELRRDLWPDHTFVDFENGLNVAIRKIREALGDVTASPRFIETERAHGYRFIAPVEEIPDQPNGHALSAWPVRSRRAGPSIEQQHGSRWPLLARRVARVLKRASSPIAWRRKQT